MFTTEQTGRPASPRPDLQKTVCGSCAACKGHLNDSTEPKLLPCLHTVCNICLTKICTDGGLQDCPSCAQSFGLSEVTECAIFEDLSDNNKAPKCGGCEENEVSGWCVQCEEALCLDCVTAHHRVKVTRDHEVTPKKPPTGWIQRRRCPLHSQESLRFFCLVCEELTCKDCQLITHRGHSFVHQEEAVESQKQQLQSLLDSIRRQKGTVSSSLLLLEARLQDIEHVKMLTKTMLIQSVHKIYRTLILKASQILKDIQAVFAEEVGVLSERKSSLNRLEGCQDYIADFIDKIQSTQGHCLLVYKKRIETQVKMLLSQETCTPEAMIKLHIEFQKDLCQHIMNFGFVRITKRFVPLTSERTQSIQTKPVSVESFNPNSVETATNVDHALSSSSVNEQVRGDPVVHPFASSQTVPKQQILQSILQPSQSNQATSQPQPNHGTLFQTDLSKVCSSDLQSSGSSSPPSVQAQSHEVMSGQSKHAYSPSSSHVPSSSVHSQHHLPLSQQNKIKYNSKTPNRRNTWTLHYYSDMPNQTIPRIVQTPALTHSLPASNKTPVQTYANPANNQISIPVHPKPACNQTTIPVYPIHANNQIPITANNQTAVLTHPITANNQTPTPTHTIPASNQTSILLQQIPANTQTTLLTRAVLVNGQKPIIPHELTANDQTLVQTQPILANNQTSVPTHAIPFNNNTMLLPQPIPNNNKLPTLTHPIPNNNQMPVLIPPIQANNQAATLTHPVQFNNQSPVLTHPVSNIQSGVQTLILAHPIQAGFLGAVHSFAAQPNVPLTSLSTVNAHPLNDVTAVSNVHSTGTSNDRMNHCPTNSAFNVTPSDSSLHAKPLCSDPINGSNSTNIPVKALADSACDQEAGVSSTSFTYTDYSESNLPTSTVSEADPGEPSPLSPDICSALLDSHSITTKKCLRQAKAGQSTTECDSGSKHWSADMPTTFHQLVETICSPVSSIYTQKATSPVGSTPCRTSEDITGEQRASHDKTIQSCFDHSEAEENEKESAATLSHFKTQLKEFRRSLCVSLVRLPVSLPPHGHPLPEFHLSLDSSTDHILVQESLGGEIKQVWRWHEGPVASRASVCSRSQMSDIDSSPASDVQFCVVCQSAGAALLCAKCGSAFHSDCHIPPIFTKPCKDWVCLLCQDVSETLLFDSGEEIKTTGLSLQDQRRCEKLLLGLQCDENMGLLYSVTKNHSKTAEFDIILGRLQGNRKPPYRTAAELVSDVWTVFDILFIHAEKKSPVVRLQQSFQQRLNESFGTSLHASLLQQFSSTEPGVTSQTDTPNQKHRNTLKRMREFFTANCGIAVKKSCNDKGKDTTAAQH